MRILFIEEHFFPHMGGVCIHILNLAKRLVAQEISCSVLTIRQESSLKEQDMHLGVSIYRASSLLGAIRFLARRRADFDLVHAHTSRRPKTAVCMLAAKLFGYPVIFTPHAYYPARNPLNYLTKFAYDTTLGRCSIMAADRVVNLTEVDRQDGLKRGQSPSRSVIIPNCINVSEVTSYQPKSSFKTTHGLGDYVLYVGRVSRIKNVEWLVRGIASTDPNLQLVVIGPDDGDEGRLKRLAEELGVSDRILWAGRVPFDELMGAYRDCTVFALPSLHEGLPTVVLEAMALGKPVIASAKGGTRTLIREGETGFFCGDQPDSMGALLRRLADSNRDNRMGENARRLVRENYDWEANAKRIAALYASLCRAATDPAQPAST
ncbi:MAG: glycosyltransferase family 4 protein [Alphaproteobacteria bacterium]|nr:glycosyltransferase family 4 protein [Alphaproteobacteria bacterium]